jgi:hypothetical protein
MALPLRSASMKKKLIGPKNQTERRFVAMVDRFLDALNAGQNRRAGALGGEMDRAFATIGKDRELELLAWRRAKRDKNPKKAE